MFGGPWGNWEGSYVVGDAVPWPFHEYVWSNVEERVEHWAAKLKRDLETPDLWAELQREREILSRTPDDAENTPFTPEEQASNVMGRGRSPYRPLSARHAERPNCVSSSSGSISA